MTTTATPPSAPAEASPRRTFWRYVILAVVVLFAAFWVWALFFASKEAANKIGDSAWAARAEQICTAAKAERVKLVDLRRIDPGDRAMLSERAGLIDKATDIIERMLDDVVAVAPTDRKGQALIPLWA